MKTPILILALSGILVTSGLGTLFANSEMDIENTVNMDIQKLIREYVEKNDGVGVSVGLIDEGKIRFFSYGQIYDPYF